jgi:F-box and WD-40 domain protein 1/11
MTSAFRLDEGFSEDTRSQAGSEMPPRPDSRMAGAADQEPADSQLPDWILGMSERERSGTPFMTFGLC